MLVVFLSAGACMQVTVSQASQPLCIPSSPSAGNRIRIIVVTVIVIIIIIIIVTVNDSIIWGVACTGAMGVPAPVHVPGDCYVWGSSDPNSSGSKSAASTVPGWLNSSVPTLVDNTTHLDVCEV